MSGPLNGKTGEVLRWCIGAGVAGLVAYFTSLNTTNQRLTKVETQSDERWHYVQASLGRIEDRQREQEAEFRRILQDWARGIDRQTGEPLPLQRSQEPRR